MSFELSLLRFDNGSGTENYDVSISISSFKIRNYHQASKVDLLFVEP